MKKLLLLPLLAILFMLAVPQQATAQCPPNADNIPCFTLPSGPCVSFPNSGKLKVWLARAVIVKADPYMKQDGLNLTMREYTQKYYRTNEMTITYLGGSWAAGQSFRVQIGGCVVTVLIDPIL